MQRRLGPGRARWPDPERGPGTQWPAGCTEAIPDPPAGSALAPAAVRSTNRASRCLGCSRPSTARLTQSAGTLGVGQTRADQMDPQGSAQRVQHSGQHECHRPERRAHLPQPQGPLVGRSAGLPQGQAARGQNPCGQHGAQRFRQEHGDQKAVASLKKQGVPPTERKARTGELTPPGMWRWARSNSC